MSKKNEYRFNLRFDETDEDHRKVCQFLNDYCGSRKKARYIVKAVLAYWTIENKSIEQIAPKPVFSDQPQEQKVPLADQKKPAFGLSVQMIYFRLSNRPVLL